MPCRHAIQDKCNAHARSSAAAWFVVIRQTYHRQHDAEVIFLGLRWWQRRALIEPFYMWPDKLPKEGRHLRRYHLQGHDIAREIEDYDEPLHQLPSRLAKHPQDKLLVRACAVVGCTCRDDDQGVSAHNRSPHALHHRRMSARTLTPDTPQAQALPRGSAHQHGPAEEPRLREGEREGEEARPRRSDGDVDRGEHHGPAASTRGARVGAQHWR